MLQRKTISCFCGRVSGRFLNLLTRFAGHVFLSCTVNTVFNGKRTITINLKYFYLIQSRHRVQLFRDIFQNIKNIDIIVWTARPDIKPSCIRKKKFLGFTLQLLVIFFLNYAMYQIIMCTVKST